MMFHIEYVMLGRAKQMKKMLRYVNHYGRTFKDDQMIFVRYMLENPDIVAVDTGNAIFATNFKMQSSGDAVAMDPQTLRLQQSGHAIGLLHCNNIHSGSAYHSVQESMMQGYITYYSGVH
jgi:hypothetical protein